MRILYSRITIVIVNVARKPYEIIIIKIISNIRVKKLNMKSKDDGCKQHEYQILVRLKRRRFALNPFPDNRQ